MIKKTWILAELVLLNLEQLFYDYNLEGCAMTYRNGRENGFCVYLAAKTIKNLDYISGRVAYFSNIRNADGIIVYVMENFCTDGVDEDAHRNAKSFSKSAEAADYILDILTELNK